jgi:myosin heavy subunit
LLLRLLGKFTELQFDKKSRLVGSVSRTYLLEKSRVIHQTAGERNFHVFHQVLSADDPALHEKLYIGTGELAYVREGSRTQVIEGKTDTVRRGITLSALELVSYSFS